LHLCLCPLALNQSKIPGRKQDGVNNVGSHDKKICIERKITVKKSNDIIGQFHASQKAISIL